MATSLVCLSLIGCTNLEDTEEKAIEEPKIEAHEPIEEKKEISNVIEVISPLKELDANATKLNLPIRQKVKENRPQPLTYRIADYLKEKSDTPADFDKKITVNLQLENVPIITAIEAFSDKDVLNFEYIIDPGVKGTVQADIYLEEKLTRYDGWKLFEELLYMGGAYATVDPGNIIRIMPFTKMPKEKRLLIKGEPKGNVAVEVLDIIKNQATDIITNIKPFMTDGASATVLTKSNAVLIVETPENMEKLRALIKLLDNSGQAGWPQMAYQCKEVDSATIFADIQNLLPILGFSVSQGNTPDPSGIKLTSIDRLNVIAFSAPTQEVLDEINKWVQVFDSSDSGEQEKLYSYPVKHGVATDLVDALTTFFPNTSAGTSSSTSGSGSSTSSRAGGGTNSRSGAGGIGLQQLNQRTPTTNRTNNTRTNNTRRTTTGQQNTDEPLTLFDMPLTVFQDIRRNKLVIRSTPRVFSMVKAILTHLDAPAMQVMIQVTAVEVDIGDNLAYGFEFAAEAKFGEGTGNIGSGNSTISDPFDLVSGAAPTGNGISALLKKAGVENEFAFAQAVAGDAATNLLFCPQILTLNGQEAEFNIGQEVPIRLGSSTTDGTVQDNIEYRDTGVILKVTPQISADKNVNLIINTEISSIAEDADGGSDIDSPVINQNTINTNLKVRNKETILLGGIIQQSDSNSNSGIPYLKDIPYLGFLFSGTTEQKRKKELVLFVKAVVIDSRSDYEKMIDRYQKALEYKAEFPELEK